LLPSAAVEKVAEEEAHRATEEAEEEVMEIK
jgi:hypothetical protein